MKNNNDVVKFLVGVLVVELRWCGGLKLPQRLFHVRIEHGMGYSDCKISSLGTE